MKAATSDRRDVAGQTAHPPAYAGALPRFRFRITRVMAAIRDRAPASRGLLDGKVALVTGGTSDIGRASAVLFAGEGTKVAFTGRRADAGQEVLAEIEKAGGEGLFIRADATDIAGATDVVQRIVDRFGRLDIAFNNAGTANVGPLTELDEDAWDFLIDGNLKSAFFYLQAEAVQIKKQRGGAIVFSGSVFAELGIDGISIYSASKGGLNALARAAAVELGPDGIRVNTVNPTIIRTPLTEGGITRAEDGTEYHPHGEKIPLGRIGEPEEVAKVVSDLASFVTGQIMVDGGQSMN